MKHVRRVGCAKVGLGPGVWAVAVFGFTRIAGAQAATTPGAVTVPHPTLEHASIEWAVAGDDNTDGVVTVRFREGSSGAWRVGLPLMRVPAGTAADVSWGNRHAGSLFGLAPDTAYEVELTLSDPDGGDDQRVVSVHTRAIPKLPADARRVDVTPTTIASALSSALPGDVLVLAAGTYGSIVVEHSGSVGRPIVVHGRVEGDAVVEGQVRMDGCSDVWVEALTVHGQIKFNGATRPVVRNCRVEATTQSGDGIVSYGSGSTDGYFADNVVIGRTTWAKTSVEGDSLGEGIVMTGPGNVIEHNRVSGFQDCISLLEDEEAIDQTSIDIVGNDLDTCSSDAIEADFSNGNVRVIGNRMVNSSVAMSSEPSLGGPTYFIRNASFNALLTPFKLTRASVGNVIFHNTAVKSGDAFGVYSTVTWSRTLLRNNLLIGGVGGDTYNGQSNGNGQVLYLPTADEATCSFDYDGFGSIGTGLFEGVVGATSFSGLAELQTLTTEANAVQVDMDAFDADVEFPEVPFPAKTPPDLRLAADSVAVDRGTALAGINDDYSGNAPDLGAYESGDPLPEYGPRADHVPEELGGAGPGEESGGRGGAGDEELGGAGPGEESGGRGGAAEAGAGGESHGPGAGQGGSAGGLPTSGGTSSAAGAGGVPGMDSGGTAGVRERGGAAGSAVVVGSAGRQTAGGAGPAGGSEEARGGTAEIAGGAGEVGGSTATHSNVAGTSGASPNGSGGDTGGSQTSGASGARNAEAGAGTAGTLDHGSGHEGGDDSGCGCRIPRQHDGGHHRSLWATALAIAASALRRRRAARRTTLG
jgi:hypothetical protein